MSSLILKQLIYGIILLPSLALASDWMLIYEDVEKGNLYINSGAITMDKYDNLYLQVKSVPNLPQSNLVRIDYLLNCKTQKLGVSYFTEYSYKKNVKPNTQWFETVEMKPIRRGSAGEILSNNFCKI